MPESLKQRLTQPSITIFPYSGNEILFLKRNPDKSVDPGVMNGPGGKVEPGEDYAKAAVRELREETGYDVEESELEFCGMFIFDGGYSKNWIAAFFKVKVKDKTIPLGSQTPDGELVWKKIQEVVPMSPEYVWDLKYFWEDIISDENIFFTTVKLDDDMNVLSVSSSLVPRNYSEG